MSPSMSKVILGFDVLQDVVKGIGDLAAPLLGPDLPHGLGVLAQGFGGFERDCDNDLFKDRVFFLTHL